MTAKTDIDLDTTATMNFAMIGLSALMHFATIFWAFTLMWKTFLFRFGLTKRLRREFPLLAFIPIHLILFMLCSAYRLVSTWSFLFYLISLICLVQIHDSRLRYSNEPLRRPNIPRFFLEQKHHRIIRLRRMYKNNHLCDASKLLQTI